MQEKGLSLREEQFVEQLPANDWIVWKAGVKAGFSENYAKHRLPARMLSNVVLRQAVEAKKAEQAKEMKVTLTWLTQQRLSAIRQAVKTGNLTALDRHLQALEKHKGFYEADNQQARAQAKDMTPDEAIAYHLRCLNRLKAAREAPDARSTG